jgi:hypothetical protein
MTSLSSPRLAGCAGPLKHLGLSTTSPVTDHASGLCESAHTVNRGTDARPSADYDGGSRACDNTGSKVGRHGPSLMPQISGTGPNQTREQDDGWSRR